MLKGAVTLGRVFFQYISGVLLVGTAAVFFAGCASTISEHSGAAKPEIATPVLNLATIKAVNQVAMIYPSKVKRTPKIKSALKEQFKDKILVYPSVKLVLLWSGIWSKYSRTDWYEFIAESAVKYNYNDYGVSVEPREKRIGCYEFGKMQQNIVLYVEDDELRVVLKEEYESQNAR